jgi:CubicO group peptidase (beta-lactamase class C family)
MHLLLGFGLVISALACPRIAEAQNDAQGKKVVAGLEDKYYITGTPRMSHSLAERMRFFRVPAVSIAVIDNYRVAWAYAAGLRDVASHSLATTSTLFQAASMSKPVAAAGILRLFEEKDLNLDADVNTMLHSWHVPAPPDGSTEKVTMRRLLSHSAGINVHGFAGYDRDAPLPTLVQVLDGAPPANSEPIRVTAVPGSATEYSGGGTSIAQQLAIDVSSRRFPLFMQQTLLDPLGMSDSTFDQPLPQAFWSRAAGGYYSDGKPVHRGWHVYPTMAAAGLWMTATDLATFVIAIQNALRGQGKPPMDATVAREMTTKASGDFGLGPELRPGYFTHNGANEGFQGVFLGLTEGGKGVAIMANSDNGILLANNIVHSVAKAYRWPVLQPRPKAAIALSPAAMQNVTGKYVAKFGDESITLTVTTEKNNGANALILRSSLDGFPLQLYGEAPLHFFTLNGGSLVFLRGGNGKVRSVQVGDTTFDRIP